MKHTIESTFLFFSCLTIYFLSLEYLLDLTFLVTTRTVIHFFLAVGLFLYMGIWHCITFYHAFWDKVTRLLFFFIFFIIFLFPCLTCQNLSGSPVWDYFSDGHIDSFIETIQHHS